MVTARPAADPQAPGGPLWVAQGRLERPRPGRPALRRPVISAVSFVLTLIVWSSRRRVVRTVPVDQVVERRAVAPRREVVEERRVAPAREEVVRERRYRDPGF